MPNYFNLNERALKAWRKTGINSVIVNKDNLQKENPGDCSTTKKGKDPRMSLGNQLVMYFGTFLGVLLSTGISHLRSGNTGLTITLGEVVLSAIIALSIMPLVYEKLMLHPKAPLIVQFGLFVQNGVFWNVLICSVGGFL